MIPEIASDPGFWTYVLVGFAAQIVDGALGMAYGTLSTAFLLSTGVPPLITSASVHTAQFFTTGISSASHYYFKNVEKRLMVILALAGAVGGIAGASLLTMIDGNLLKPYISAYLMALGILILWRIIARKTAPPPSRDKKRQIVPLGITGGFLDALGGGGWGPIVTTSLMVRGRDPRMVIGTVNAAEFVVKTSIALAFIITIGFTFHEVVLGLLIGGVLAAPLGAYVLRFIKPQMLMGLVGVLILSLSAFTLVKTVFL